MEDDRHVVAARAMRAHAKPRIQSNLTNIKIEKVTRNTHFALVLMPKWAVMFAPYNLARLAGVSRAAGYRTSVLDFNVRAWSELKSTLNWAWGDGDSGEMDHVWVDQSFHEKLLPILEPTLTRYLDELVALQPDVIGFSLYYTNMEATLWMIRRLRERLPHCVIVGGGSQIHSEPHRTYPQFDCLVKGEGEELLLQLLDDIEKKQPVQRRLVVADGNKRINLDALPYPDYSDLYRHEYFMPHAAAIEISRGCVAKCTFCAETWFWKYRGRQGYSVLDEMEYQYRTFGINTYHFIDSLVNGNLAELREFALGVAERKLAIWWYGYARCDGRMDLAYFQDLKAAGCYGLNFGIESGSDRVLELMKKNITVDEIEHNLRDATAAGLRNYSQWLFGFPGETTTDAARTMTLAWRVQQLNLDSFARGTMVLSPCTVTDNKERFGIRGPDFLDQWCSVDLKNTKLHRLVRLKVFNILIDLIQGNRDTEHRSSVPLSYRLERLNPARCDCAVSYDDFSYDIIRTEHDDFTNSLLNEPWPLFRLLWKAYGPIDVTLHFTPEADLREYGAHLAADYQASYRFQIDDFGKWKAETTARLVTPPNVWNWGHESMDKLDYSFECHWQGEGAW